VGLSGKFQLLESLIREGVGVGDRFVLISNFTQTLDLVEEMLCKNNGWLSLRLDGSMDIKKRQVLVDLFNGDTHYPLFLLSSKAGGCGINLIGANRLVMIDADWNPATDLQSAARIWREGQLKECFVYRFFIRGSIEEQILQRQLFKSALNVTTSEDFAGGELLDSGDSTRLLQLDLSSRYCDTHDRFLQCPCGANQNQQKEPVKEDELITWAHVENDNDKFFLSAEHCKFLMFCLLSS
jgi:DNA repair and recombination RAD54-like protein